MYISMNFFKYWTILLLYTVTEKYISVQASPTNFSRNVSEKGVVFEGWKPMVIPEALTPAEFVEKVEKGNVVKVQNSSDLEAADTKRSFLLVYPPRPEATEQDPKKEEPPQNTAARTQGPPLRSYPTQSRYHRMMNFGIPEGISAQTKKVPSVYQRPKFPPVANPPPLPEHAVRQRPKLTPNFTPESTSQHQVQIQLLDGYIVPPVGGAGTNIHAEKKTPQITTFPLNLNNVPEIRLLLPGDVHQQLNNLRNNPQQQQNPQSNAYNGAHNQGGRNNSPNPTDRNNIYSFESQRRPGRTVEYSYTNRNNANGRPQQSNYNQNQDNRKPDKPFSPRDPAIYPEVVNFPGQNNQNFQNSVNNAVSYNHIKTNSGDAPPSGELPNRNQFVQGSPNGQNFPQSYGVQVNPIDERGPISHSKTNGPDYQQNYGGQRNPVSDNRSPLSQTRVQDFDNGQGIPQNYGNQQNSVNDNRTPLSQTRVQDFDNGQGIPQNYGSQQNSVNDNRTPLSQTRVQDFDNGQGIPQNYGSQQNSVNDNRTPISQTVIRDFVSDQGSSQNYGNQQNAVTGNRSPSYNTRTPDTTDAQGFAQNYGGQQNPSNNRGPRISQTDISDSIGQGAPQNNGNQQNQINNNRTPVSQTKIDDLTYAQGLPQNYAGQQNPTFDNRNPVRTKTQGTINVQSYSPNSVGQQNPTFDNRNPVRTKTQGTINVQSYSPNSAGQRNPSISSLTPGQPTIRGSSNGQNIPQNVPVQQKYEPGDIQTGQFPIEPFQRTRGNFKPTLNNNRNYNSQNGQNGNTYISPQNYNTGGTVSSLGRTKINNNGNDKRNYQSGWRATTPSSTREKQNLNPVGVSPGKVNFFSNNVNSNNNQNINPLEVQQNGPTATNFSFFGNGEEQQKSHGAAISSSGSDRDSRNRNPTHMKSHGSNFSPSSSGQDSLSRPTMALENLRGRRTSADDETVNKPLLTDRKTNSDGTVTDDIYFVPPVLTQDEIQTKIDAFDGPDPRDTISTSVGTPADNELRDGNLVDQKDVSDFVSVDPRVSGSTGSQTDAMFERTGFCECTQSCAPVQRSRSENLGSSVRNIAKNLNADAFFDFVGLSDEEIENMLASDGAYTLFIPSNEAVSRLPSNLIDHWRENNPDLRLALLNHVVRDRISLDQLKLGGRMTSRANDGTIFINNYNNEAVTVNGHRIVYGDVTAPRGGIIHVVDGTLCPVADQDIINTLRTCNKYDGFLTLADVTKLLDTMQDEGPFTVFLPSNEALTKIPADELAVLKENATVLREFLEYHIVRGAYFSGDLKDGQYLTTLHQRQPIRMGVRVDGCYRRLVEANNSPLFKSDIPTKNGVIHVVDWVLRPSDLQWCEGVVLP